MVKQSDAIRTAAVINLHGKARSPRSTDGVNRLAMGNEIIKFLLTKTFSTAPVIRFSRHSSPVSSVTAASLGLSHKVHPATSSRWEEPVQEVPATNHPPDAVQGR